MRDYLEELLGLVAPEEDGEAAQELGSGPGSTVSQVLQSGGSEQIRTETADEAGALMPEGESLRRAVETGQSVRPSRGEAEELEERPVRQRREEKWADSFSLRTAENVPVCPERAGTVEIGDGQTGVVLRDVVTGAARAAGYRRVLSGQVPAAPEEGVTLRRREADVAANVEARRLDRVFQRDARRYDCGFALF